MSSCCVLNIWNVCNILRGIVNVLFMIIICEFVALKRFSDVVSAALVLLLLPLLTKNVSYGGHHGPMEP